MNQLVTKFSFTLGSVLPARCYSLSVLPTVCLQVRLSISLCCLLSVRSDPLSHFGVFWGLYIARTTVNKLINVLRFFCFLVYFFIVRNNALKINIFQYMKVLTFFFNSNFSVYSRFFQSEK